jgi:hypothetical protein
MPTSPSPPPPAAFSFTAGDFDYPQATTLPPSASRTRGRVSSHLRRILNTTRLDTARADEETPRAPLLTHARRRELLREARRPSLVPLDGDIHFSEPYDEVDALIERVRRRPANDVRHYVAPVNPFAALNLHRRERSPQAEIDAPPRQSKRRKIDHAAGHTSPYDGFKYGYKGQVVSGRLNMALISCDGGEHDRHNSERLYKAQNVLNNDKSVYCSEDPKCNLLLNHQGGTPFCLDKVVIRAPNRGFTAPVQEGLVFVSMSADRLISGTAAYQIDYASRSPAASPSISASDELLSLREAMDDPQTWEQSRRGMEEQIQRLRLRSRRLPTGMDPPSLDRNTTNDSDSDDALAENCPYHGDDGESIATGLSIPPFTVTNEEDDDSDDNATMPSPAVMADRLRRESRWRPESDDEEDGEDAFSRVPLRRARGLDSWENFTERRWRSQRSQIDPIRATRLRTPSRIAPTEDATDPEAGLIEPHARFFIARHKNKITIKFHPPISGKYVLLKLWSPTHDGNIDIESVQLYGFSGPRFFPAVKPC